MTNRTRPEKPTLPTPDFHVISPKRTVAGPENAAILRRKLAVESALRFLAAHDERASGAAQEALDRLRDGLDEVV